MTSGALPLFVLCVVFASCPYTWSKGVEFKMNWDYDHLYDQLLCTVTAGEGDDRILSIIDTSIIDFTNPRNKWKLASASVLESDLYAHYARNIDMKVNGSVSQYQAKLDIRFSKKSRCELGNYLCEAVVINIAGHIDKIHAAVKAKLPDDIRSDVADNQDLILTGQLNELNSQLTDTVNLLTNRTDEIEESLAQLTGHIINMKSLLDKCQDDKKDGPSPRLGPVIADGSVTNNRKDGVQSVERAEGSRIHFSATPDTVTLGLTRSLSLRCSVSDTADQSNSSLPVTGRGRGEVKGQLVSPRGLIPTLNTEYVTSMVITKIGEKSETVAIIVAGDAPVGNVDEGRLEVQGQLFSQPDKQGYLELTWSRPSSDLRGIYECKLNAINSVGQAVSYVQDIQVNVNEPSILQLVDRLLELESDHNNTKQQLSQTTQQLSQTAQQLSQTTQQLSQTTQQLSQTQSELTMTNLDQNITKEQLSQTQSELNTAKQQISALVSTMTTLTPPHVEQGTAYFDSWNSADIYINYTATQYHRWGATNGREFIQHVVFSRPYNSIPVVMISTSMMRTTTSVTVQDSRVYIGIIYQVNVENVTTHGFIIRCVCYYSSTRFEQIDDMNVDWMSTIMG